MVGRQNTGRLGIVGKSVPFVQSWAARLFSSDVDVKSKTSDVRSMTSLPMF